MYVDNPSLVLRINELRLRFLYKCKINPTYKEYLNNLDEGERGPKIRERWKGHYTNGCQMVKTGAEIYEGTGRPREEPSADI